MQFTVQGIQTGFFFSFFFGGGGGVGVHFYISVYNTVERELVDFSCKIEMLKLREVCMCKVFVTHSLFLFAPMNAFCHFEEVAQLFLILLAV